ncbi:MAG: AAA family ATPase [Phycisphaerales bacterium]
MRTVVIVNQKGGCGKTTTAINLAGLFASRGQRALLVDLDPQSHCAAGLAIPEQRIDFDIADALVSDAPLDPARLVWSAGRGLDLIPSRTRLAGLEAARGGLATKPDKERRLARVLHRFADQYDVALVDCSPSIGLLTYNAITAATDILVPVETGFFSLQGAMKQARTIESLQKRLESAAPFWLLPTLHEPASALAEELLQELRRRFSDQVIPHAIRRDIKLKEAVSFGQPVIEYDPEATGARDYADLADWLQRLWSTPSRTTVDPETAPQRGHSLAQPLTPAHRPEHPSPLAEAPAPSRQPTPQPVLAQPVAVDDHPIRSAQQTPAAFHEPKPEARQDARTEDRVAEIAALARKLRDATLATAQQRTHRSAPQHAGPTGSAIRLEAAPATALADPPANPRLAHSVKRDMLGARATNQGVLFVQPIDAGRQIAIAGDFNGWSTRSNRMTPDPRLGVHQACIHLPPGRHRYRLVIDGRWTADPHNQLIEPNEFGETNSVVVVHAPRG